MGSEWDHSILRSCRIFSINRYPSTGLSRLRRPRDLLVKVSISGNHYRNTVRLHGSMGVCLRDLTYLSGSCAGDHAIMQYQGHPGIMGGHICRFKGLNEL